MYINIFIMYILYILDSPPTFFFQGEKWIFPWEIFLSRNEGVKPGESGEGGFSYLIFSRFSI